MKERKKKDTPESAPARCGPVGAAIFLYVVLSWQCLLAQQHYIGGNPQDWDLQALRDVLTRMPQELFYTSAEAEAFINVMVDYASEGYVPRTLSSPVDGYVQSVKMEGESFFFDFLFM